MCYTNTYTNRLFVKIPKEKDYLEENKCSVVSSLSVKVSFVRYSIRNSCYITMSTAESVEALQINRTRSSYFSSSPTDFFVLSLFPLSRDNEVQRSAKFQKSRRM